MTQVISADPRAGRPPALHRRALRPQLRARSGPGPAHRRHRRLQRPAVAALIQQEFSSETLRLYTSTDVIGVELGGALKNVIAIAAGVAAGVGLGHNSTAALITRGIAEITRLAVACGGRRETLAGLSGVGDLVLTCTGSLSRNRTVGQALGQGRKLPEILESLGGKVAEGVLTTRAALGLARKHRIEMPITEQMELILNEGKDPREAIRDLMLRPGKDETLANSQPTACFSSAIQIADARVFRVASRFSRSQPPKSSATFMHASRSASAARDSPSRGHHHAAHA